MNRRKFLTMMGSGIAAANGAIALPQAHADASSVDGRPNFLFIIADDLAWRTIGSLSNQEVHTPNIDRLVASGTTFTHCFHQGSWSGAVCVPSRTMLNSGLTAFHAQAALDDVPTWGQTLGAAGYDTYICGKWHLDPTVLQRSFREMGPVAPGMLVSTPENGAAYSRPRPGDTWQPWDESLRGHWLHTGLWDNQTPDRIQHADELYSNHVIDQLHKATKRTSPFFLYLGFNSPHDPRQAPREFLDRYPQSAIQVPPNFLPQHPFDQGDFHVRDEMLAPFPRTPEAVQLHRREYYALITYMDEQIGRILRALDESGKASNTYVILTADHGLAVGEHGLLGKQNLYDCSVRMPLIIAGPGIQRGRRIDDLVYQHCLYATTCELTGVPVPSTVEFPSLVPLLRGQGPLPYDDVFCYYREFQRSLRTRTHKLIVYPQVNRTQLFDLEHDPWEIRDLSGETASRPLLQDLKARLVRRQRQLEDPLILRT